MATEQKSGADALIKALTDSTELLEEWWDWASSNSAMTTREDRRVRKQIKTNMTLLNSMEPRK